MIEAFAAWVAGFLADFLRGALSDWRRDRALTKAGRYEAIEEARRANDEAAARARGAVEDWRGLGGDDRERMRDEWGHYRD